MAEQMNNELVAELISRLLDQNLVIDPYQAQHILEATNNNLELAIRIYMEDAQEQNQHMHGGIGGGLNVNEAEGPHIDAPPRRQQGPPPGAAAPERLPDLGNRNGHDSSSPSSNGSLGHSNGNHVIADGNETGHNISMQDYASLLDEDERLYYEKSLRRVKMYLDQKYNCEDSHDQRLVTVAKKKRKKTFDRREIFLKCLEQFKEATKHKNAKDEKMSHHVDQELREITKGSNATLQDRVSSDDDRLSVSTTWYESGYEEFSHDSIDDLLREGLNFTSWKVSQPSRVLWGAGVRYEHNSPSEENGIKEVNCRIEGIHSTGDDDYPRQDSHYMETPDSKNEDHVESLTTMNDGPNAIRIPRTWLSAGFYLSKCGTGLVLNDPTETDVSRLKSIQPILFPSAASNIPPPLPPFHCGGITQLTSIVTALLYSGACIQGRTVKYRDVDKKPFDSLTLDEKRKEFPSRLAEALSAILWVAGESGMENRRRSMECVKLRYENKRKKRKSFLSDVKHSDNLAEDSYETGIRERGNCQTVQNDKVTENFIMSRSNLCTVCRWNKLSVPQPPAIWKPLDEENLSTTVSLTKFSDLRSFVISNLRSFMGVGGIALFLETLVHTHGRKNILRKLKNLRLTKQESSAQSPSLISCRCERKMQQDFKNYVSKKGAVHKQPMDSDVPTCHDCAGPELMSLLLTGKPRSDFTDWTADMFGIGFLSSQNIKIHPNLMKPMKPVWIVQGKSSYFVLWEDLASSRKSSNIFENADASFHLCSWESWPSVYAKKSKVRIIPKRHDDLNKHANCSKISENHFEETKCHPDDLVHYDDYRRRRYMFLERNKMQTNITESQWIPFFRLNSQQKDIVQRKYSRCRDIAIWSILPGASIEDLIM